MNDVNELLVEAIKETKNWRKVKFFYLKIFLRDIFGIEFPGAIGFYLEHYFSTKSTKWMVKR